MTTFNFGLWVRYPSCLQGFGPPYAFGFRAEYILLVLGVRKKGVIAGFATQHTCFVSGPLPIMLFLLNFIYD